MKLLALFKPGLQTLLACLLLCCGLAQAGVSVRVPANYDGTIDTATRGASNRVEFLTNNYQVGEEAGSISLGVQMINGDAACTLHANTADVDAVAGTNYTALVNQAVTFSAVNETVSVPVTILDDDFTGTLSLTVTLTKNSCASVTLGSIDVTTVTIQGSGDAGSPFPADWTFPATVFNGGLLTFDQTVEYDSGATEWTISVTDGGEIFNEADHFTGPVNTECGTTSDCTLTAEVTTLAPATGASYPLAGVMMRAHATLANAEFIFAKGVGPDGGQGYDVSARTTAGASVTFPFNSSTPITLCEGFRAEIDRQLTSWKAYKATDCSSPSYVEYASGSCSPWCASGNNIYPVLAATASDGSDLGYSGVFKFDDVVVSTAGVDHSAASTVTVLPITLDVLETAGTFNFTMERSGGLSGALAVDWTITGGTCVEDEHYTGASGQLNWDADVGGLDSDPITVINIPGVQGAASCGIEITATINSGSDSLDNDILTARWLDADQTPEQIAAWSTQGASNCVRPDDGTTPMDAFIPGMRGHGSCNVGGFVDDTNVIVVTNRNLSGTGSFTAAVNAACPKVVLFGVSGFFDYTALASPLRVGSNAQRCDNWSMVGASAPGNVVIAGRSSLLHGGYGLAAVLQTRGSYWTIDHMTFTGGGSNDAIDIGSNVGIDGDNTHGILMNSNLIWGGDEIVQHYTDWNTPQFNTLLWQNYIGQGVDGHAGAVILQNTARNAGGIRNFVNDTYARSPLTRADGTFWANNLIVNEDTEGIRLQPCAGGGYSPIDSPIRMHVIGNLYVSASQGDFGFPSADIITHNGDDASCAAFSFYETGNQWKRVSGSFENCTNHNCIQVAGLSGDVVESIISAVYPTGYVPETVAATQQASEDFAAQIKAFAGARPTDRLTFIETRMTYGVNSVIGAGTESSYVRTKNPPAPTIAQDSAIGGAGTSYTVITESEVTWDPTDSADNPCAENMPTGAAANAIKTSGLTGLHEWVIGCFYDNVMPSGYREDDLENYTAP